MIKPEMYAFGESFCPIIHAAHPKLGDYYLVCDGANRLLFTENETNNERIFGLPSASPYVKDGINNYVVHQQFLAVNPELRGNQGGSRLHTT
jgi:hypothetical protein